MKNLAIVSALALGVALSAVSAAFAQDSENTKSATSDTSVNPITKTRKTVRKHKVKTKDEAGNESSATQTDTTKQHTDGSVEKSTTIDAKSKNP